MSLPDLTGQTLVAVEREYRLGLDTREGWFISIEDEVPVGDEALATALADAVGQAISQFEITEDGVLTMTVGQAHIRAVPDPDYESWHITGPPPSKQMVVCTPGGELAIWS